MDFWTAVILFVVAAIIFALGGGYLGKKARAKELAQNPAGIKPVAYADEKTDEEEVAHHDTIEEIIIPEGVKENTEEVTGAFVPVNEETAKKDPSIEKENTETPIEAIVIEPEVDTEPKIEPVIGEAEQQSPTEAVTSEEVTPPIEEETEKQPATEEAISEEIEPPVEEEIPETKFTAEKKD